MRKQMTGYFDYVRGGFLTLNSAIMSIVSSVKLVGHVFLAIISLPLATLGFLAKRRMTAEEYEAMIHESLVDDDCEIDWPC